MKAKKVLRSRVLAVKKKKQPLRSGNAKFTQRPLLNPNTTVPFSLGTNENVSPIVVDEETTVCWNCCEAVVC
jgi:hypothetical protein